MALKQRHRGSGAGNGRKEQALLGEWGVQRDGGIGNGGPASQGVAG